MDDRRPALRDSDRAIRQADLPRIELNFSAANLLVGTETRWIDSNGVPCTSVTDGAIKQERFSITTEWKDVDE